MQTKASVKAIGNEGETEDGRAFSARSPRPSRVKADGSVTVRNAADGAALMSLPRPEGNRRNTWIEFHPDGNHVLLCHTFGPGGDSCSIEVYDASTGAKRGGARVGARFSRR